jgi:hypothetical protein
MSVVESRASGAGCPVAVRVAERVMPFKVAPSGPPAAGPVGPLLTVPTRPATAATKSAKGRTVEGKMTGVRGPTSAGVSRRRGRRRSQR